MGLSLYIKSTDWADCSLEQRSPFPSVLAYNLNNVCDAGASPIPNPVGLAPRFSGECIMYQLQIYGNTVQKDCQGEMHSIFE